MVAATATYKSVTSKSKIRRNNPFVLKNDDVTKSQRCKIIGPDLVKFMSSSNSYTFLNVLRGLPKQSLLIPPAGEASRENDQSITPMDFTNSKINQLGQYRKMTESLQKIKSEKFHDSGIRLLSIQSPCHCQLLLSIQQIKAGSAIEQHMIKHLILKNIFYYSLVF